MQIKEKIAGFFEKFGKTTPPMKEFNTYFLYFAIGALVMCIISLVVVTAFFIADIYNSTEISQSSKPETVMLYKDATVCSDDWTKKKTNVVTFIRSLGIMVFEGYETTQGTKDKQCKGCDCLSGKRVYIRVLKSDADKLMGFQQDIK